MDCEIQTIIACNKVLLMCLSLCFVVIECVSLHWLNSNMKGLYFEHLTCSCSNSDVYKK